ncbi:WXG100 family type VII secretion target [Nocardia sp. NPDC003979]
MSDDLNVHVDRLRAAAQFTGDKAEGIRSELTKLDNTIGKELLVDGWQGTAASAYDESWLEWKHGAESIIAALTDTAALLAQAATQYESTDTSNRDAIVGLNLPDPA